MPESITNTELSPSLKGEVTFSRQLTLPVNFLKLLAQMPTTRPRRPYDEAKPNSWMQSDEDYIESNYEAVLWFLENAEEIRATAEKLWQTLPNNGH